MICKGAPRGNAGQLSDYLSNYLHDKDNEKNKWARVEEISGSQFPTLHAAMQGWEAEAQRTKCKHPLYHAEIAPRPGEYMTHEQKITAADILAKELGMAGHPRAIVTHRKLDDTEHIHVVWLRMNRDTGTVAKNPFTYKANCRAARQMEDRFGFERVDNPSFDKTEDRQTRREKSKAKMRYADHQQDRRNGTNTPERKALMTRLWRSTDSGKALRCAIEDAGYVLARGDKRVYVIVDRSATAHSLPRQIDGAKTSDVRARLADIEPGSVPLASQVQREMRAAIREREDNARDQIAAPAPEQTYVPPRRRVAERKPDLDPFAPPPPDPLAPQTILDSLTRQQSTFTNNGLKSFVSKLLRDRDNGDRFYQPDHTELIDLVKQVRKLDDFAYVGDDRAGAHRYSSKQMVETEAAMRDGAASLADREDHRVRDNVRDAAPSAEKLGGEQKAAFEHITKGSGLSLVVGYAGTGKSTMLGAAREAWEGEGYRVRGAALSSMAARALESGSGIQSRTLHSMVYALDKLDQNREKLASINQRLAEFKGRSAQARVTYAAIQDQRDRLATRIDQTALTKRDVVVLDEAGMVGSRQMRRLIDEVNKAGAKLVMVGDSEQLQAIDAGGAFRAIKDRHGAAEITEVWRQKEDWQRAATKDFAQSYTVDAIQAYASHGRVEEHRSREDARTAMVEQWKEDRRALPDKTQIMLAYTRKDVAALNYEAREIFESEGRLSGQTVEVSAEAGRLSLAKGDRMYFLKNDARLEVMNGTLATVTGIEQTGKGKAQIAAQIDGGKTLTFDTKDYAHLAHGYASTVHKSQGATVDRAYVMASGHMDRHAAYVGMTRHRDEARMYYSTEEFGDFTGLTIKLQREQRKDTTLDYERPTVQQRRDQQPEPEAAPQPVRRNDSLDRLRSILGPERMQEGQKLQEHIQELQKERKRYRGLSL